MQLAGAFLLHLAFLCGSVCRVSNFAYSVCGLALTEAFEGCRLTAYQDPKGVWTIGYGHTGKEVVPGLVWTQQQANKALALDVEWAATIVNKLVTANINQHQFDALVDFTFNEGATAFAKSTLLECVNSGNMQAAEVEFGKWIYSGKIILPGLVKRRKAEVALFTLK